MSIATDERYTPPEILNIISSIAPIVLDPCAAPDTRHHFGHRQFTKEDDGLSQSWAGDTGIVYCNPPYSRGQVELWIRKAAREAAAGVDTVMLTSGDFSTAWWQLAHNKSTCFCLLNKRIKFIYGGGSGAKFASTLWLFGDRYVYDFYDALSPHGVVYATDEAR